MEEITIVTAFFDIGREKWPGFERDNSKYVENFKFWARMKNKLVVYTDQETARQVQQIRESFGLKDRTQTVVVDDITTLDPDIYQCMEKVLANELAIKFRRKPASPESYIAMYDYVMYLKTYFIVDAIERGLANGMISWMDFGYNHGGKFYTNPLEFDFLWQYDFSAKIHLFSIEPLDETPIFEIVRDMKIYISGGIVIAPAELWKILLPLVRRAIFSLASCGLMDDDQTLLIMAYREHPEFFEIHPIEDFFCPLKDCGCSHLTSLPLRKSKKSRKTAKRFWNQGQYLLALQWYFRYFVEKLRSR
ncbi:MAG: HtrL family protein [Pelosinus sp.]|nr:HtrL family protein [Pelosinus sp.]